MCDRTRLGGQHLCRRASPHPKHAVSYRNGMSQFVRVTAAHKWSRGRAWPSEASSVCAEHEESTLPGLKDRMEASESPLLPWVHVSVCHQESCFGPLTALHIVLANFFPSYGKERDILSLMRHSYSHFDVALGGRYRPMEGLQVEMLAWHWWRPASALSCVSFLCGFQLFL